MILFNYLGINLIDLKAHSLSLSFVVQLFSGVRCDPMDCRMPGDCEGQGSLGSGSFPMSWLFGTTASASVLLMEYSGLISFRIDWFGLLAFQGTLKSLLQHHILKASILQCSAFLMVQFSHPYITPGKTIALTIWTFVGKVMSLLLNMLSRFVIVFIPRRNVF